MKEEINLLPPLARQARVARVFRRRLRSLTWRFGAVFLLLWLVIAGSAWELWRRQQGLARQLSGVGQQGLDAAQEVRAINELLSTVDQRVTAYQPSTAFLDEVVAVLPAQVRLTLLAFQRSNSGITVKGVSSSRTAVVELQQKLEALPQVEKVEAPLQNFAVDAKGEFSFTIFTRKDNE